MIPTPQRFRANLISRMDLLGIDDTEMAAALRISRSTWFRKKTDPGKFDINEVWMIAKKLGTTLGGMFDD